MNTYIYIYIYIWIERDKALEEDVFDRWVEEL